MTAKQEVAPFLVREGLATILPVPKSSSDSFVPSVELRRHLSRSVLLGRYRQAGLGIYRQSGAKSVARDLVLRDDTDFFLYRGPGQSESSSSLRSSFCPHHLDAAAP